MLFWTKEEYLKFADAMMDKPKSFYAFELLYWCGMREGELLALTPSDFDLEKGTVTISKALRVTMGEVLTELRRIEAGEKADQELLALIDTIAAIMGGLNPGWNRQEGSHLHLHQGLPAP